MGDADEGFTLIEILVTLVIIGISVSAVLAGLGVASRGSGDTRASADASAILTATAEQIERATYQPCPSPTTSAYATARAAVDEPTDGTTPAVPATVVNLTVWDGDSFEVPVTGGATCDVEDLVPPALGAANRMQRITVRHGDDTLTFVKRGP